jgi:eukaryotic-like serine/threonine-protein kinase
MPAIQSTASLLDLCQRSRLLDAERVRDRLGDNGLSNDPTKAANQLVEAGLLTGFQAQLLLEGKYKGFFIGPYKLLDELGTGGMGAIFLCEHTAMRRRVAMKVLPKELADNVAARERFHREARAAAALDHPNIVRIHDVNAHAGVHYIVMEYLEGSDLSQLLKESGPTPHARAVHYIMQAAEGLRHAHAQGLIHRDIKPANLFLTGEGTVKVLDLGLARRIHDPKDDLTRQHDPGAVVGSVDYLAPEAAMASPTVDHRADIYSLGMTLYALIAGKAPFGGTTNQKLLHHQLVIPRPLHELQPNVPPGLSEVVARMMAKGPAERQQSAGEVIEALAPWSEAAGASTLRVVPPGGPSPSTKRVAKTGTLAASAILRQAAPNSPRALAVARKRRVRKIIIGGSFAAVAVFTLGAWLVLSHVGARQHQNGHAAEIREPASIFEGHTGEGEGVAFLPNGRRFVSLGHDGLRLWDLETGKEVPGQAMGDASARSLSISADGKRAASAGFDNTARIWDLERRGLIGKYAVAQKQVAAVAILPDGRRFAAGSDDGTIAVCDANNGQVIRRLKGHQGQVYAMAAASDGRHLLSGGNDHTVRLWDMETGAQLKLLAGHDGNIPGLALHWEKRIAVSGGGDQTARIWDLQAGVERHVLRGHTDVVTGVAISPDGTRVLTTSGDKLAILWDVASGAELRRYEGHTDRVRGGAFSPSGAFVVTTSKDCTLRCWKVP